MALIATCHCGRCDIGLPATPDTVTDCNCSICRRYGTLWAYYDRFDVDFSRIGPTETYVWNGRTLVFHRCAECGCVTHWIPTDPARRRMGVNARLLPPDVLKIVPVHFYDGASAHS